jgi:hypothetical protein
MKVSSVTGGMAMVRAFVLIQIEVGKTGRVAREVGAIEGTRSRG